MKIEEKFLNYSKEPLTRLTDDLISKSSLNDSLKRGAFDQLDQLGFPTLRSEQWRYTNLAPLYSKNWSPPQDSYELIEQFDIQKKNSSYGVTFLNQCWESELNKRSNKYTTKSLSDYLANGDKSSFLYVGLNQYLKRIRSKGSDSFFYLNWLMNETPLVIEIKESFEFNSVFEILFLGSSQSEDLFALSSRSVFVLVNSQVEIDILETVISRGKGLLSLPSVYFVLDSDSRVTYTRIQDENSESYSIGQTSALLKRDAVFQSNSFSFGARVSRHDLEVDLLENGAEAHLNGLYVTSGKQVCDNHTTVNHLSEKTTSRQLYKGVLNDSSRAIFNGKIFIAKESQQVDSNQLNKNLLLSEKAEINSKPELEVFADDVKANHGSAIGQIDEEKLFYFMSRGISRSEATALISFGYMAEIIYKIKNEPIRDLLLSYVKGKGFGQ